MAYRVEVTAKAYQDLRVILKWLLAEHSGETGLRWYQGLTDAIETLSESPHRCSKAPESEKSRREIRHLLYGRKPNVYRILFTVDANVVTVLHIRRPRQNVISLH